MKHMKTLGSVLLKVQTNDLQNNELMNNDCSEHTLVVIINVLQKMWKIEKNVKTIKSLKISKNISQL